MKIARRAMSSAGFGLVLAASVLADASPASAASGVRCTTASNGGGYWFFCSGTKNGQTCQKPSARGAPQPHRS
jgi:hypothetical protein